MEEWYFRVCIKMNMLISIKAFRKLFNWVGNYSIELAFLVKSYTFQLYNSIIHLFLKKENTDTIYFSKLKKKIHAIFYNIWVN